MATSPAGTLTMLSGHPFVGKSMLVGGLVKAIEGAKPFLGRPTSRSTAVVLMEEDDTVLRVRAEMLGLIELESTFISRSRGALAFDWRTLVEHATQHAVEIGHGLLVVDTFPGLAGLRGEEENDAGAVGERLRPLQRAAGEGLAVLLLHHMNAYGQPRGSKAFRGIVDTSIRFQRTGKGGAFRLDTESRFPTQTTLRAKLVETTGDWSYVALGTDQPHSPGEGTGRPTDACLRQALVDAGPAGLTYQHLDSLPGLSMDIGKKRLPGLFAKGVVGRRGAGTRTDPYYWFVPTD
jgi:AAA domain